MCVSRLTEQDTLCFTLSQNGLKYSQQGLRQLLLQVVLCVDGNVVLQNIDGILQQHAGELLVIVRTGEKKKEKDAQTRSFADQDYRPLTSCMLLLPLQPWWWRTELGLPGLGHCLHLFFSFCNTSDSQGQFTQSQTNVTLWQRVSFKSRTSQPAPHVPVCQRTPGQCALAPWW